MIAVLVDHLGQLVERFSALDGRFLLPALALQLANLGLRALAWRNVLAAAYPDRRVAHASIAGAYLAGVALNAFAPARGGELAKVALARTRIEGSRVPTVAASLTVVLLFDALFGGALLAVLWASGIAPGLPSPPQPAAAGAVILLAAATAAAFARRSPRVRRLLAQAAAGGAVLRTPARYARTVAALQLGAWACRIGVVMLVLAAFGIAPSISTAVVVLVAGGLSAAVPVPGGGGTQQVLVAYALHSTVSVSEALSFSIGMQAGVAIVNTLVGLTALLLMFRTLAPTAAVRAAVGAGRRR